MTHVDDDQGRLFGTLERLLQIPATDVVDALRLAAQVVTEALGADKVSAFLNVFLYDAARSELVAVGVSSTATAQNGQVRRLDHLPLATGGRIVGVYRTGEPYRTGHADQDPQVLARIKDNLGVRSMIAVPLDVSGERRGVLAAASKQPEAFSAADLRFLQAMARLMGVAIERIHLQQARAEAAELAERNRLRADFLATLSHDLQTPLTALRAGLGLLATSIQDRLQPEERALLESSRHNVERLRLRIGDLLTAHEVEAGTLELNLVALDLRRVIERAVTVVRPLFQEKGQALEVHLPEPLPIVGEVPEVHLPEPLPIVGEVPGLERVFLNLLANANRHTPEGTRVTVSGRAAAGEVHVVVRDTGPGIPATALEAIFAPFHRRAGGGTGLGLANMRTIVALHGGQVWAESPPGQGAAFHVVLARHDAELLPERPLVVAGLLPALTLGGYTGVLVGTTSVPVWSTSPLLGALFMASSLSTGAAATSLASSVSGRSEPGEESLLSRISLMLGAGETVALAGYAATSGKTAKPLTKGLSGLLMAGATASLVASTALEVASLVTGRKRLSQAAAAATLVGGALLRWGIMQAGHASARDREGQLEAMKPTSRAPGWGPSRRR